MNKIGDYNICQTKSHWVHASQWGFVFSLIFFTIHLKAQLNFDSLQQKMEVEPKYILMNISSRSCIYCMIQEKKIRKDNELQQRLNNQVYFLSWQIEEQDNFIFHEQDYVSGTKFIDIYGRDENGNIVYPLWLLFDENYNLIFRYFGLQSTENIEQLLDVLKESKL